MRTRSRSWAVILSTLLLLAYPLGLQAQETGPTVVIRGPVSDNLYIAGGTVHVLGEAEKDLVAIGGTVNVEQMVKGDAIVAGGIVTLVGPVGDDVRAAGGVVTVGGAVGGDAVAIGGTVTLGPEARVAGRAWLTGAKLDIGGRIGRELRAAGATVRISGQIEGNVHVAARRLVILPTARINGDLSYTSPKPARIAPGAKILGTVRYDRSDFAARAWRIGRIAAGIFRVLFLAGLIAAGAVLLRLFPEFTVSAARTIRSAPWPSLGVGVALLVAVPAAGVLLMATIAGIPIGLTLIAAYCVCLLLGYLITAVFLGEVGARLVGRTPERSTGSPVVWLVLALIVLAAVRLIPFLGGLTTFLALVLGLGALGRHAYRCYAAWGSPGPPSAAEPPTGPPPGSTLPTGTP